MTVYRRDGWDHFIALAESDLLLCLNILPKMAAGCLIGVFSTLLIPREVVARLVGAESGFTGLRVLSRSSQRLHVWEEGCSVKG